MTDAVEVARAHLVEMEEMLSAEMAEDVPCKDELRQIRAGIEEADHDYWEAVDAEVGAELSQIEDSMEKGMDLW